MSPPEQVLRLECLICGAAYDPDEVAYVCPHHGDDGILDVVYDYERIGTRITRESLAHGGDPTMWRYRPLLPVSPDGPLPPLAVGWTPLYRTARLGAELGLRNVWVKDEGVEPTGSLKDRASAVAVARATSARAEFVTTASTGNAAAALAGVAASTGQATVIFVPASAPEAKVAQLLAYGANVLLVEGTYDEAFDLCLRAAERFGWYNRSTGYNPYMSEGKKTAAFEIAEQLDWTPPDAVLVPVGDGCIIGGLHKGFRDLLALGWVETMPRLIGVQAAGSAFLAEAWERDEDVLTKAPVEPSTVADSIGAGLPRDRLKAMRAVRQSGGAFLTVDDDAILAAIPDLAAGCGVFAEPAAAAAWAGLAAAAARGLVAPHERVVVLATGTGLKDVPAAMQAVRTSGRTAHHIQPDLEDASRVVAELPTPRPPASVSP